MPITAMSAAGAPNGPSVADLCQVLSDALGVKAATVNHRAGQIRKAGMLPTGRGGRNGAGAARVEIGHAINLLLAVAGGDHPPCVGAGGGPDAVRVYGGLPLANVWVQKTGPDGLPFFDTFGDDSGAVASARDLGDTLAEFLTETADGYNCADQIALSPEGIHLGGGLGNLNATVYFGNTATGDPNFRVAMEFSLFRYGERIPDDAPVARLDRGVTIPGSIFQVLRDLFGSPTAPRFPEVVAAIMEPESETAGI